MKKFIVHIACITLLFSVISANAGEYTNGGYLGGKIGVNYSGSTGANNSPNEATFAYILNGGYLQGGYIFTSRTLLLGVGGFFDQNPSEKHGNTNGIEYGSRSAGVDAKVGLPLGYWMPYAKLGYGYSTGTKNLNAVAGNSLSGTLGIEYKFDTQWSFLGEYKFDGFGGKNGAGNISNKALTFGFNYYFNAPEIIVAPIVEEVFEEEAPKPIVIPTAVTDAPPI
ncbi:MAG: outer membrane beta-barrel protein [Gallionella sp.]